jgi:hypothetical protein
MDIYEQAREFKKNFSKTIAFRIKKHSEVIQKHLNPDEKVLFVFCGQKNFSSLSIINSCVVALTNKRIIIGQKRLLWGYQITIITPELFNDLKILGGLFWGKVEIDTIKEVIFISNLDKKSLDEIETYVNNAMVMKKEDNDVQ